MGLILLLLVCLFELHAAYPAEPHEEAKTNYGPLDPYRRKRSDDYAYPYAQDQSSLSVPQDTAAVYRRKRSDDNAYAYAQDQSSLYVPEQDAAVYRRKRSDDLTYNYAQDQSSLAGWGGYPYRRKRSDDYTYYANAQDQSSIDPAKRAAELPYYAFPAGYEYMPTYAHHAKRASEQPAVHPYFLPQYEYIGAYPY